MPSLHRRASKAFTLLEAVVVLAIIGILLGIAVVAWNGLRQQSQNIAGESLLGTVQEQMRAQASQNELKFPTLPESPPRQELVNGIFVDPLTPSVFPESAGGPQDFTVAVTQVPELPNFIGYAVETNENSCFTMLDRTVPGPGPSTLNARVSSYPSCKIPASCVKLFAIDPQSPEFAAAEQSGFTSECTLPPPAPLDAPTCLIAEVVDVSDPSRTQDVVLKWTKPNRGDSPQYTYVVSRTEGELAAVDASVRDPDVNLLDQGFATGGDEGSVLPTASSGVEVAQWSGKGWQGSSSWLSTFPSRQANGSTLVASPQVPVAAGEDYTFSTHVATNPRSSSKPTVRAGIQFVSASGSVIDTPSSPPVPLTGSWQEVSVSAQAPADAVGARVVLTLDTSAAKLAGTGTVYSDGFLLNTGAAPAAPTPRPATEFEAGNLDGMVGTYTDTTAAPGVTYTYVVYAKSVATGEKYPASDPITLATTPAAPQVSALVTSVVTLVWNPVTGADSYEVTRVRYGQATPTVLATIPGTEITSNGTVQFTDDEAVSGAAYTYTVKPVAQSQRLSVCGTIRKVGGPGRTDDVTSGVPLTAPVVTAELTSAAATATDEGTSSVTWEAVGGEVLGYDLDFYNAEDGPSATPQVLPQGTYPRRFSPNSTLADTFSNLGQGSVFVYRARAVGEVIAPSTAVPAGLDLSSPWGTSELNTSLVAPVLAVSMTDQTAGGGLVDDAVLTWNSNPQATSYAIEYLSSTTGTWQTLNPTVYSTTYTDLNVPAGTARTYRVRAERNIVGSVPVNVTSPWSNEVSVSVPIPAPTNVACQVDNGDIFTGGDERVVVSWSGPANPYYLSEYYVSAYVDGAEYAYTQIPASSGITSWTQTPPGPGTWSYAVYAVTPSGVTSQPATVGGCVVESPLPLPPPPPTPPCRPIDPACGTPTPPPGPIDDNTDGDVVPQGGDFVFYKPTPGDKFSFTNYGRYTLKAQSDKVESVLLWLVDPNAQDQENRRPPTFRGTTISRAPDKVVTSGLTTEQVLDAGKTGQLKWDALADKDPWTSSGERAVYWVYALPVVKPYTAADASANKLTVDAGRNGTLFSDDASPTPDWVPSDVSSRAVYFFQPEQNQTKNVPSMKFEVPPYYARRGLVKYDISFKPETGPWQTLTTQATALEEGNREFSYLPAYNPRSPLPQDQRFRDVRSLPNLGFTQNVPVRVKACAYYKTSGGKESLWHCGQARSLDPMPTGPKVPSVSPPSFQRFFGDAGLVEALWGAGGNTTSAAVKNKEISYRATLNGVQPKSLLQPVAFETTNQYQFFGINDFGASESKMYGFQVQARYGKGQGVNNDFPFDYVSPATNTFFSRNPAKLDDGAGKYVGITNPYTGWTGSYEMNLSVKVGLNGSTSSYLLLPSESSNTSNGQVWCMDLGFAEPGTDADAKYEPVVRTVLDGFTPSNSYRPPLKLSGMNASGGAIQPGSSEAYRLAYLLNNFGTPSSINKDAITEGKAAAVDYALRELTRSGSWQRSVTEDIWKYVKTQNVSSYASTHYDRITSDASKYAGPYTVTAKVFRCSRLTTRSTSAVISRTCLARASTPTAPGSQLDTERTYEVEIKLKSAKGLDVPDGWYVTPYTTQGVQPFPAQAKDGKATFTFIPIDEDAYFTVGAVVVGPSPSVYARLPKDGVTSQRMLIGGVQDYLAESASSFQVVTGS